MRTEKKRYLNTPPPRENVTTLVIGFYYLRNLPLKVGTWVVIHFLRNPDRHTPERHSAIFPDGRGVSGNFFRKHA